MLLDGTVKANPASLGPDFAGGKMLDIPNIPRTLPLVDYNVTTQRGNYITARCNDANKILNIRGKFAYSGTGEAARQRSTTRRARSADATHVRSEGSKTTRGAAFGPPLSSLLGCSGRRDFVPGRRINAAPSVSR